MENQIVYKINYRQGEAVYLSIRNYKNRVYMDLRIFFKPKDSDEMRPTKKGITVPFELIGELKNGFLALEKKMRFSNG